MTRALALYFVAHTNDDGDNLDLFVAATSLQSWISHWRAYYRARDELPTSIYRVPTGVKAGALRWHSDGGVPVVWRRP